MNNQKQNANSNFEQNAYIQDFNNQLSKYPRLRPYVHLDCSSDSKQNQETKKKFLDFNSSVVMESVPTFIDLSENMLYFYSSDNYNIYTVIYLSHEIWKLKVQKYQEKISIFSTLNFVLHFYLKKHSENKIVIEYQKLIDDFQNEIPLVNCYISLIHQIKKKSHLCQSFDPNKKKLYSMYVHDIAKCYENYNYLHCLQHIFEAAVSSKQFIFYDEINSLIQNYQNNTLNNMIFNISKKIASYFGIKKNKEIRILLISLMRYVYDHIYPSVFQIYFAGASNNLFLISSNIVFKQLHSNIRLFPPPTRPSKEFRSVLRKDPYYDKAIISLEEIQFMTNPLDMLFCIQRSLKFIEEAAHYYSHRGNSKPINFYESISIFLAVVLSSDIPEFFEIHKFINDFFYDDELFPELCFVRAAFESCISNLSELEKGNPIKKII